MLCCICKDKEATVHLTQIAGDKMQKVDLCEECAKSKGVNDPTGFSLADLLLGLGASQEIEQAGGGTEMKCPRCGFTQADFKKAEQIYEAVYGKDHSSTIGVLASLADVYLDEKRYADAERELRDVITRFGRLPSADPLRLGAAHIGLGEALGFEKKYKDAEVELLAGYGMLLKQAGPSAERVQAARSDLVAVYDALHEPEKAARFRADARSPSRVV